MLNLKYFLFFALIICLVEYINTSKIIKRQDQYGSENNFAKINGYNREKLNHTGGKFTPKKSSSFRFSALGLITLILTVILSGIFIYYFFLFYPILCRKERNYDVVEHSRDTTPTPNVEKPV